jgi:hypothetical protein
MTLSHTSILSWLPIFRYGPALFYRRFPPMPPLIFIFRARADNRQRPRDNGGAATALCPTSLAAKSSDVRTGASAGQPRGEAASTCLRVDRPRERGKDIEQEFDGAGRLCAAFGGAAFLFLSFRFALSGGGTSRPEPRRGCQARGLPVPGPEAWAAGDGRGHSRGRPD